MRRILSLCLMCLIFLVGFPSLSEARIKVLPIIKANGMAGKSYFEESEGSLRGNISLDFMPVLKINPTLSLFPYYSGSYQGSRGAVELQGGGKLQQKRQDHLLSLKVIKKVEDYKLKARAGYELELLRETKDETWGEGLFDYERTYGLVEVERIFRDRYHPADLVLGLGGYRLEFPNYDPIATGTEEWKELSEPGHLDYQANEVSLDGDIVLAPNLLLKGLFFYTHKDYLHQRAVNSEGMFSSQKREDDDYQIKLGTRYTLRQFKTRLGLNYIFRLTRSTQNHFDIAKLQYLPNFYDSHENRFSPTLTFYLPHRLILSSTFEYRDKRYKDRLIQDEKGNYLDEELYSKTYLYGLSLSYPLPKGFCLRLEGDFKRVRSNMDYEAFYNYNYETKYYGLGVSYEY
ncbi:MAG: hypothetical protein QME81_03565 [bacterium]|nr:hypothetical protein [bacterium]